MRSPCDEAHAERRDRRIHVARAAADREDVAAQDLGFCVLNAEAFARAPKKSIDYAVMEKTEKAALIPADIGWSDVGTWRAVWELSDRDASGNSVRGQGVVMDATNVHVRSEETLTTVVGVSDVIVVTTHDAVLVVNHEHGDRVKQLVDELKTQNRREAAAHKRIFRPWGYYQSIDEGQRFAVLVDYAHTPDPMEKITVEVDEGEYTDGIVLYVPEADGSVRPYKTCASIDEWRDTYFNLLDTVRNAKKLTDEQKAEKVQGLTDANRETVEKYILNNEDMEDGEQL